MKKLGLALGSGGSRGVAHIGFLKALEDNNIKPFCISGSSMGSVVGAGYAHGLSPDYMLSAATALRMKDIFDLSPVAMSKGTLLKSKKLALVLDKFIGGVKIEDLKMPFSCVGTDIISGKKIVFNQGNLALAVQASSSIPMVFAPVPYENYMVADGGVLCRVPVEETRALGADVVIAVDVLGKLREISDMKSILSYFLRLNDIYDCTATNINRKLHPADLWLEPDLGDMSQYKIEKDKIKMAFQQGYNCALSAMSEIKALLK